MGVYINDFEVTVEPTPAPAGDEGPTDGETAGAAPSGPTPDDVKRIVGQHHERLLRIRAH